MDHNFGKPANYNDEDDFGKNYINGEYNDDMNDKDMDSVHKHHRMNRKNVNEKVNKIFT